MKSTNVIDSIRKLRRWPILAISMALVLAVSGVVWASLETPEYSTQLAGMMPQGALLTIESTNFAELLNTWNASPEKAAWLKTDNYEAFSRSRLFGRLGEAQVEFAKAAGLPPDMNFVKQVAGKESIFGWYDIGKLEFVYITRMPSAEAEKSQLLQLRNKFQLRIVGTKTFYVRTLTDQTVAQPRTVAFATSGDWLLLATREDLMAHALTLIQANHEEKRDGSPEALSSEPWFADAHAAGPKQPGQLRMTLDLEKILPSPYFRSYWVQRNITELKQYRSAITDLYMAKDQYREERVLLPKSSDAAVPPVSDLSSLTSLLPSRAGVYRASSSPSPTIAVDTLNEKLIARLSGSYTNPDNAPTADLIQTPVTSTDFETRIDTPAQPSRVKGIELASLRELLSTQDLSAMMTISRTDDSTARETASQIYVPFESAVMFSSAKDWDEQRLKSALQQAYRAGLTTANLGLNWKSFETSGRQYSELGDARPLQLAIVGKVCILTDDVRLMSDILASTSKPAQPLNAAPMNASLNTSLIGGFSLAQERGSFARWTTAVDGVHSRGTTQSSTTPDSNRRRTFFSGNLLSLSEAFSSLKSEQVEERRDGPLTRQTVTYTWNP